MNQLTYISLFSSAGVGCYGFKMEGFDCVATNELLQKRLDVQKVNHKCKYNSGYVLGDILLPETKQEILNQLQLWKEKENLTDLTVLIATPPCQGMSVANHKKKDESIMARAAMDRVARLAGDEKTVKKIDSSLKYMD